MIPASAILAVIRLKASPRLKSWIEANLPLATSILQQALDAREAEKRAECEAALKAVEAQGAVVSVESALDRVVPEASTERREEIRKSVTASLERQNAARRALAESEATQVSEAVAEAPQSTVAETVDGRVLRNAKERLTANLDALAIALGQAKGKRSDLLAYSGWGGLGDALYDPDVRPFKIKDSVMKRWPEGCPVPDDFAQVQEYYTPAALIREVHRVLQPYVPHKPSIFEPSAGVGRFIEPWTKTGEGVTAVELSAVSSIILRAAFPQAATFELPFEQFAASSSERRGTYDLLLANPPYATRKMKYRELDQTKGFFGIIEAQDYFMLRGAGFVRRGGISVWLVPGGFLSGSSKGDRRAQMLADHHLMSAYKLPQGLFPAANLDIDLLFFQRREAPVSIADEDLEVVAGRYFTLYPHHILGTVTRGGKYGGAPYLAPFITDPKERAIALAAIEEGRTKEGNGGEVKGTFKTLPDIVSRALCSTCEVIGAPEEQELERERLRRRRVASRVSLVSDNPEVRFAQDLGKRIEQFFQMALFDAKAAAAGQRQLVENLNAWAAAYGNPHSALSAVKLDSDVAAFLSVWTAQGLDSAVTDPPEYLAGGASPGAIADATWNPDQGLNVREVAARAGVTEDAATDALLAEGWCVAFERGPGFMDPESHYYTGALWTKRDAAKAVVGGPIASAQLARLDAIIEPKVYADLQVFSPREGWIPEHIVQAFALSFVGASAQIFREPTRLWSSAGGDLSLSFSDSRDAIGLPLTVLLGYLNSDKRYFVPERKVWIEEDDSGNKRKTEEPMATARNRYETETLATWKAWLDDQPSALQDELAETYARTFTGYRAPEYGSDAPYIARWDTKAVTLRSFQAQALNQFVAQRRGLCAFDVGLGKTYLGVALVAKALQDGWAKRPVVVVPNTLAPNWWKSFRRALPDFRVEVVGYNIKPLDDAWCTLRADNDTPEERAVKWRKFQAGQLDVVICTETAFYRNVISEKSLRAYSDNMPSLIAEATLEHSRLLELETRKERDEKKDEKKGKKVAKKPVRGEKWKRPAREYVTAAQKVEAFLDDKLTVSDAWKPDPGIVWENLAVDMLVLDEAQRFKNLYSPEQQAKYLGNVRQSSRAWHFDYRAWTVAQRTGGKGVFLLSATPAKNSPLEIFSLIQYVDRNAWVRRGLATPGQFASHFLTLGDVQAVSTQMRPEMVLGLLEMKNLQDLRQILEEYATFKNAVNVGLYIPEQVTVAFDTAERKGNLTDLTDSQEELYVLILDRISRAKKLIAKGDKSARMRILGLQMRLTAAALHPELIRYADENKVQVESDEEDVDDDG